MALDILVDIFANSPPSVCIALGFVLTFFGYTANNNGMINAGWGFVGIGAVLQVGWLFMKSRR
jgi:hypothetical protein